jgi:hypothetical protein
MKAGNINFDHLSAEVPRCWLGASFFSGAREASWTIPGAVITMIVDKKLEILHIAEKPWRFDHLKPLVHRRFLRHLK